MSFFDLLALITSNLGRRKARVALTAIGVVIGTAAVVVLVSLGAGLQKSATEQLGNIGDLTQIMVQPGMGDGGGGPIFMGGGGGGGGGKGASEMKLITNESLKEFAALPGVVSVIPRDGLNAGMTIKFGRLEGGAMAIGMGTNDLAAFGWPVQGGTLKLGRGQVVIGAMIARNFYDPRLRPGQEPPPPPDLLDKQLKFILSKYTSDGQEVRKTIEVRVVGVIAETRNEQDFSIYMTLDEVTTLNEWVNGKRINRSKDGYQMALVKATDSDQVLELTEQITQMGYMAFTPQQIVQSISGFFLVLQAVFGGVGAIALLVAAIGIANTMTMAILERTREIGLMKAIGATNRDVLSVFLGEAAGIGFIGGVGGVTVGWGVGQVVNQIAIAYFASQASQGGGPPPTDVVYTPLWLPIFAVVFATLIGLLSGLYPALRAATLVPVMALKYE